MPKKHETLVERQLRLEKNKEKRGMLKRLHNNRAGQPQREQSVQMRDVEYFKRKQRLGYL